MRVDFIVFVILANLNVFPNALNTRLLSKVSVTTSKFQLYVTQPRDKQYVKSTPEVQNTISVIELFTPPFSDGFTIATTLLGQAFLVNLSFVINFLAFFFTSNPIGTLYTVFDTYSMQLAASFTIPLLVGIFIFNSLPYKVSKDVLRDSRFYTLRILGRNTSIISALVISLVLAATAGFSEELLFRGIIFNSFNSFTGFPIALVLSSIIFGFVHFPLWGANAIVESIFGAVLGFAFWYTDYNLAVPIAIHTMYDFATLFFTWLSSRNDLKMRMKLLDKDIELSSTLMDSEIDTLADAVFATLDYNKDGYIDLNELNAGLKLYGYGFLPLNTKKTTSEIFNRVDTNKDNKIDATEFKQALKEDVKEILTWPF